MRSCAMRKAEAVVGGLPAESAQPAEGQRRHSSSEACAVNSGSCSVRSTRAVSGSHVRAPRGPRARTSSRSTLSARLAPLPSRTLTLPSRSRSTTVPSRHRPRGRLRQRTRSPADSPSAASSGRGDAATGSARLGVAVGLDHDPEASTPTSNHGACSLDAHGDLSLRAAGMPSLAAASSREACSSPSPRRDRPAGDLPALRLYTERRLE
jgi:hypothetical protein